MQESCAVAARQVRPQSIAQRNVVPAVRKSVACCECCNIAAAVTTAVAFTITASQPQLESVRVMNARCILHSISMKYCRIADERCETSMLFGMHSQTVFAQNRNTG